MQATARLVAFLRNYFFYFLNYQKQQSNTTGQQHISVSIITIGVPPSNSDTIIQLKVIMQIPIPPPIPMLINHTLSTHKKGYAKHQQNHQSNSDTMLLVPNLHNNKNKTSNLNKTHGPFLIMLFIPNLFVNNNNDNDVPHVCKDDKTSNLSKTPMAMFYVNHTKDA